MNNLTALSLSIGILSGVATFLTVGPAAGLFLIWALTISWAAYFAFGASKEALKNVITCCTFGVVMAWTAAVIITTIPAGSMAFPLMAAVAVTVSVVVLCLAANIPQLATIPASVLGYSATFAYLLQTPDKLNQDVLLSVSWGNPLLIVTFSLVLGAYFGVGSVLFSAKLQEITKK